jgi:integrase
VQEKSARFRKERAPISKGTLESKRQNQYQTQIQQAGYVTSIEMRSLWNTLFSTGKPKPIESAVAFGLCYCTGARMGEVLALRIEDTKTIQDEGEFIRFFIRSSKTDPFNKRMETLNLPTSVEHVVPIVSEVRRLMRGRREGLVFAKLNSSTRMASDYIGRYRKLAGIETRVRINFPKMQHSHAFQDHRAQRQSQLLHRR